MTDTLIVKTVGWGTAASNIGPLGNNLHVIVHNWHSMHDGPINVAVDTLESENTDHIGNRSSDRIRTTQTIHATWLPSGSNRLTAPNIRVGERVEILQESDRDVYYWRPAGLDEYQRRLETVVWGISASPNEDDDVMDPNNRYWIEFSSHSKKIVLTTSSKNGEPARYMLSFDLAKAIFNLMDSRGNYATLTSLEDNWKIGTPQGSFIEIDKIDINVNVVRNLNMKVGNDLNVEVGNNINASVANSILANASTSIDITGGGANIKLENNIITWTASEFIGN